MTENHTSSGAASEPGAGTAPPPKRPTDMRSVLIGAGIVILLLLGFVAGRGLHPGSASAPATTSAVAAAPPTAPPATTTEATAAPASALAPVDAAPSPAVTSQVAATAAPQPPGSVVGNWSGKFQWNGNPLSPMQWQFNPDGTLVSTSGPAGKQSQSMWAWRQRGNEVEMYLAGNTFYGTINGTSMTGTMRVVRTNGSLQNTGMFDAARTQ